MDKNFKSLYQFINEGRPKGSKNKPKNGEELESQENVTLDDVKGETAEENGSEGVYEIEPPTDDEVAEGIDFQNIGKNKKRIAMRLSGHKPFFVQGEAGWGKTSIITDVAHRFGYTVMTVYLDKAEATDLQGIPSINRDNKNRNYTEYSPMPWMKILFDNPKTKFLLFFDEMNQAQPDVMNALMPIVLKNVICGRKLNNILCCGAGNFEEENRGGISKLSGPLESRFGGVIVWQSGDWADAFRHLKAKYKDQLDDQIFTKLENSGILFKNPRDVESFIIDYMLNIKNDKYAGNYDAENYLDELKQIAKHDLSRTGQDQLAELADEICMFVNRKVKNNAKEEKKKNRMMLDPDLAEAIKQGIEDGYMEDENGNHFGVSRENIMKLDLDSDMITAQMLESYIDMLETDGVKFKYEKDDEWRKQGFKDPVAEDFILSKNIKKHMTKKSNSSKPTRKSLRDYTKE